MTRESIHVALTPKGESLRHEGPSVAEGHFFLPTKVSQDNSLSYEARGLLATLYAYPEHGAPDLADLMGQDRPGFDRALREAVDTGWVYLCMRS